MSIIVSCNRGHNASTTLLVDGEIVFYLEEERLTRFKRDGTPLMGLATVSYTHLTLPTIYSE